MNLKKGLERLGHKVDVATYGDGFKFFSSDINIGSLSASASSHVSRAVRNTALALSFKNYDVVQVISPEPFYRPISGALIGLLRRCTAIKIFVAAGSDAIYRNHIRDLDYYPPHDWFVNTKKYQKLKNMLNSFDAVVPVCWEYKYCMEKAGISTKDLIPLPINLINLRNEKALSSEKIRVYHPINRVNHSHDFKGTLLIVEAFKKLEENYGEIADFTAQGGMPYSEYLEVSEKADIVVDQAYSYSYGMSAAIALSQGKVVLSGLEDKTLSVEHYKESPVINIIPDKDDIENKISKLLDKKVISEIGQAGRLFAEKYHDSLAVAKRYENVYMSL